MNRSGKPLKSVFFGDRRFYRALLAIIIPVIIQNGITNFVSLLDNLMVGALGDAEMSGVAVGNQLIFIFNLCLFGGGAGADIYGAQFFGAGDLEGVRHTFRFKLYELGALLIVAMIVFGCFGSSLISLFLKGDGSPEIAAAILSYGKTYILIMLIGLPAFTLSQTYVGTMRATGETQLPMVASVAAVGTNALFNYLLIFGKLGFPKLGVVGAATATVLSRYVELFIILFCAHRNPARYTFVQGLYASMKVPGRLIKPVLKVGLPLLANEALWSTGISTQTAVYSLCGLSVVSALSIASTISNMFSVITFSMGTAVSVMVGQSLGASKFEEAKANVWRIAVFGLGLSLLMVLLMLLLAPVIPNAYTGITQEVKGLASDLLTYIGLAIPIQCFANVSYFTLRSGGKTVITFFFDCVYVWVVSIPLAYVLISVLGLPLLTAYPIVLYSEIIKDVIGFILIKKGVWIQNIIGE